MQRGKNRAFWGAENRRLGRVEFAIRVGAIAVVAIILIVLLVVAYAGSETDAQASCVPTHPVPTGLLKDGALILATYIVLASRREKHMRVFVVKTMGWLILFGGWIACAFTLDAKGESAFSFWIVLATIVGGFISPFIVGPSIFMWQQWPEDPAPVQPAPIEVRSGRLVAFVLGALILFGRVGAKRRLRGTATGSQG